MGTWSAQILGNDTACDWVGDFVDARDRRRKVAAAIDAVLKVGDDYLDSDLAVECLAACEVIARLKGHWGVRDPFSETLDAWIEEHPSTPAAKVVARADRAIARILGPASELPEFWKDSKFYAAWKDNVDDLRERVARKAVPQEKPAGKVKPPKQDFQVGSIVDLGAGHAGAFAVITFMFTIQEQSVQVAIFRDRPERWDENKVVALFYVRASRLVKGSWPVIGQIALPAHAIRYTRRYHAGTIYEGDQVVRKATADDFKNIPIWSIPTFGALKTVIGQLISGQDHVQFRQRVLKDTRWALESSRQETF
jgi:hypothetical protein